MAISFLTLDLSTLYIYIGVVAYLNKKVQTYNYLNLYNTFTHFSFQIAEETNFPALPPPLETPMSLGSDKSIISIERLLRSNNAVT